MELIIPEGIRILSEPQSHASLELILSMDSLFLYEQGISHLKRWICVSEVDQKPQRRSPNTNKIRKMLDSGPLQLRRLEIVCYCLRLSREVDVLLSSLSLTYLVL